MKTIILLLALTAVCYTIPVATPNNALNAPVAQTQESTNFLQKDNAAVELGPNDWFDVSAQEVTTDPKIQDALSYGISQIINEAVQKQKAPIAEYTVTEVKKVQRQVTGSGFNYRFEVTLTNNGATTTIKASFTVAVRNSDQQRSMLAYNYSVQSTTSTVSAPIEPIATAYTAVSESESTNDQDIQSCLNFGLNEVLKKARADGNAGLDNLSTQVKSVEKQLVQENYAFYRFNVEQRNDRVSVTTTFVIQFNRQLRQPTLKSLLYKVITARATGVIVTDDDGYTQVQPIDVQKDAILQGSLEFGVAQVIEKALAERKVPISRYTVTNIESAAKKNVGEIYLHKFSVELGNGQGTTIKASFTIKYNAPSVYRTVAAFSYSARTTSSTSTIGR